MLEMNCEDDNIKTIINYETAFYSGIIRVKERLGICSVLKIK